MFKSRKHRARPKNSIRFVPSSELVSDIRQVEVFPDEYDAPDGDNGMNNGEGGSAGIELIYDPMFASSSGKSHSREGPCDSNTTHATDSTSSRGSPSWRSADDDAEGDAPRHKSFRGIFANKQQSEKASKRTPLVRTLLCKKYRPEEDVLNDNPEYSYPRDIARHASSGKYDDAIDELPPPSLMDLSDPPVSEASRPTSLDWPESPISRRSRCSSPFAGRRTRRSRSPAYTRSKSPRFGSRPKSPLSHTDSASMGLPPLTAPPDASRRATSPFAGRSATLWELADKVDGKKDEHVKEEIGPIEPRILARLEESQAPLETAQQDMESEGRKPSSIHVIRGVSRISRISGFDENDDGDKQVDAGDNGRVEDKQQATTFGRERSLGDDSIAHVRRALEKVQIDLEVLAKSGKKASREEITQKLMTVANSLESSQDRETLKRGLSRLKMPDKSSHGFREEPSTVGAGTGSSFGRLPGEQRESGDGDSSSFSDWLTEIENDSSSGGSGDRYGGVFGDFGLGFFLGLPPSKGRRGRKERRNYESLGDDGTSAFGGLAEDGTSAFGTSAFGENDTEELLGNAQRPQRGELEVPRMQTIAAAAENDESAMGRIRTNSFERHAQPANKPSPALRVAARARYSSTNLRRPVRNGYIANQLSRHTARSGEAPGGNDLSVDSIDSSQFQKDGSRLKAKVVSPRVNRDLCIVRSEDDMNALNAGREENGRYDSLFVGKDGVGRMDDSTNAVDSVQDDDFIPVFDQKRMYT